MFHKDKVSGGIQQTVFCATLCQIFKQKIVCQTPPPTGARGYFLFL